MRTTEAIVNIKYKMIGLTKLNKDLTGLQKLFEKVVASGKKAGLTKKEITDMIKLEFYK